MSIFNNKVVIVTGATRGIGRAISCAFFASGANLAICSRNEEKLIEFSEMAKNNIKQKNQSIFYFKCDIGNYEEVKEFIARVNDRYKRVDILINNAGIGVFNKIESFKIEDWNRVINTNINGSFNLCHEVIPIIRKNSSSPKGYIINIGSLTTNYIVKESSVYSCSKAALKQLSEHLFNELREEDILVSYIAPGSVNTSFSIRNPDSTGWKIKPEDIASITLSVVSHGYMGNNSCITYAEIKAKNPIKTESYKE